MRVRKRKHEWYWEFHWFPHPIITRFSLCDVSYECLRLCRNQHTFTFVILGIGFSFTFWTGKPCTKKEIREMWDGEYIGKKKLSTVKRKKRKK